MKIYSIGRETGCDIVINDNTDVISRRHATLTVGPRGKMTITDQSHNGTYVNGMRISSNVAVPVTRKDRITFAQIARLDWSLVPDPTSVYKYVAIAVGSLAVVGLLIWGGLKLFGGEDNNGEGQQEPNPVEETQLTPEELERREKARQDSIREATRDSINKANQAVESPKPPVQRPPVQRPPVQKPPVQQPTTEEPTRIH